MQNLKSITEPIRHSQLYLIVIGIFISFHTVAQTLPRVSKDKEIGFTNDHIGRTWDMLYNTDFSRGRDWNIQIPVQTNGISVINGSNGETYTTSLSPSRIIEGTDTV